MKATLNFSPERVKSSRLMGVTTSGDSKVSQAKVLNGEQTFLYQLELQAGSERVGSIDLEVEDAESGYLPLLGSPREESEVSDDFLVARVLGEFGQWGASESRDTGTLGRLAQTTKGLLAKVTDEKTRYALDMILLSEESLKK